MRLLQAKADMGEFSNLETGQGYIFGYTSTGTTVKFKGYLI